MGKSQRNNNKILGNVLVPTLKSDTKLARPDAPADLVGAVARKSGKALEDV